MVAPGVPVQGVSGRGLSVIRRGHNSIHHTRPSSLTLYSAKAIIATSNNMKLVH